MSLNAIASSRHPPPSSHPNNSLLHSLEKGGTGGVSGVEAGKIAAAAESVGCFSIFLFFFLPCSCLTPVAPTTISVWLAPPFPAL